MDEITDTYKTIAKPSEEILFKEKKSKFFGYAFPVENEEEVKDIIDALKKKHPGANHVCYAWQMGVEQPSYRANDDGEPNNSAGMPIYGQIQSFEVTNVLVAVARIFGGTKLGVGGLISAYRTGAQMALEASKIEERLIEDSFELSFEYSEMDKVMRILKQRQCNIVSQQMEMDCKIIVSIRKRDAKSLLKAFEGLHKIGVKPITS